MKRSNRFQQSTNSCENNAMLQLRIEGEPLEAGQILKSITTDYYQKHSKERCSCDTLYAFFSDRENRPKNSKTITLKARINNNKFVVAICNQRYERICLLPL
jgi:hypothetical protein